MVHPYIPLHQALAFFPLPLDRLIKQLTGKLRAKIKILKTKVSV